LLFRMIRRRATQAEIETTAFWEGDPLVVLWRLRYKLALRGLPEMFLIRGIVFSYEAVAGVISIVPSIAQARWST
jgi:hypothetical protein